MCDGPTTIAGLASAGAARNAAARESAVALLAAAEAVVGADRFRSPGPEIEALADAALMFAMAGTAARWGTRRGPAQRILVVVSGVDR